MSGKMYKAIRKSILENFGFTITQEYKGYNLQQYTPEGEDWNIYLERLKDIKEYAETFSPEDEFTMWFEAKQHGVRGVPDIAALWQDQLWKQELLNKIANKI